MNRPYIVKIIKRFIITIAVLYVLMCSLVYVFQENLIFFPEKLSTGHKFEFKADYEELMLPMRDGVKINALLFKSKESKGCVFYLHGNAGSLNGWADCNELYTSLGYDFVIIDYRGYGKSEGEIDGEELFYSDLKEIYTTIQKRYAGKKMIVIGYSIGTGPAAMLASEFRPDQLILKAPYYNLTDRVHAQYPFLPGFLLKYKFATDTFLKSMKCPVTIFHGDKDKVIYYGSSLKLKELFRPGDKLVTIKDFGHNGMNENETYISELKNILNDIK